MWEDGWEGRLHQRQERDASFVELERIFLSAERLDEGRDGVVFAVDFPEKNNGAESPAAAKILKVYEPGKGEQEFTMQSRAYIALQRHSSGAQVPRPMLFQEWELTDDARIILEEKGFATESRRLEVLMMELINGVPIGTMLLREALRRIPDVESDLLVMVDRMPHKNLQLEVGRRLGFVIPDDKDHHPDAANAVAFERNMNILVSFLRRSGFVLDKAIMQQLQSGVEALHQAGIRHADLHDRNVMVAGSVVYIIDFGRSCDIHDWDEHEQRTMLPDELLVNILLPLSRTQEEEKNLQRQEINAALDNELQAVHRDKRWEQVRKNILQKVQKEMAAHAKLLYAYEATNSTPQEVLKFLDIIHELRQSGSINDTDIKNFLQEKLNGSPGGNGRRGSRNQRLDPYRETRLARYILRLGNE